MTTPGIADPYWFEWYVGLKYVIKMLNPDSKINCVTFQCGDYDAIDDVVVEYADGSGQVCYQVKHEISTSIHHNLTFGKLIENDNQSKNKCLLSSIFNGWKNAIETNACDIKPILFTNRKISDRRITRTFNNEKYTSYPIDEFLSLLKNNFLNLSDCSTLTFEDKNLTCQWNEMCDALNTENIPSVISFINNLTIEGNQPTLEDMEKELILSLSSIFACTEILTKELFGKLIYALTKWTTTRRHDEKITIEDVYSALGTETDTNESQHRLAPPYPFFESRKTFCQVLEQCIQATDKKVVFISGNPGSGKTSMISYLQSTTDIFLLRYHTFRPISPEQHFYNVDSGMCSSENLWGTFLIQLRQIFKGKLAKHHVPINNKLLTTEMMREHVKRLLGVLAEEAIKQNKKIYICIDGIDHAARSNNDITFLSSLFLPTEIPNGVCFVIVGQPSTLYQNQYPVWLTSGKDIEYVKMPELCTHDIEQLIISTTPQFENEAGGLAEFVYKLTQGNNLSTVFAIEEIKSATSLEAAMNKLNTSGITADIQQYYSHVWNFMKKEIINILPRIPYPESIIACPILLMNGRVNSKILSRALKNGMSPNDWELILSNLYPLIIPCNENGEYAIFHNDFRVFLMSIISRYQMRYEEIALLLAEDLLQNDEGLLTYVSAIPLLQCANKKELIPEYFTPEFVINALAEGVSKNRLDDYAVLSYEASCSSQNMDGYINTYLAIKTLYQHNRYFEYYERDYTSNDCPEISVIDISEIRTVHFSSNNIDEYRNVLSLCIKLYKTETNEYKSRALALYMKWFEDLTLATVVSTFSKTTDTEFSTRKKLEMYDFLKHWGQTAAKLNIALSNIEETNSEIELHAKLVFGDSYFVCCMEQKNFELATNAIHYRYVTQKCFGENLELIYYNNLIDTFEQNLSQIPLDNERPLSKLLATAILATKHENFKFDKSIIEYIKPIKHIYDETSFSIILDAFLLGYSERLLDDIIICGHVKALYKGLQSESNEINQLSHLIKFAGLLGKYYWDSKAKDSKAFMIYLNFF